MKSLFRMLSRRRLMRNALFAMVALPLALSLGVTPALSQGRRVDDPYCKSLAAEALKPLPPADTAGAGAAAERLGPGGVSGAESDGCRHRGDSRWVARAKGLLAGNSGGEPRAS